MNSLHPLHAHAYFRTPCTLFLLPASESVGADALSIFHIITLHDVLHDDHEVLLAGEVILVSGVGDFVSDTIDVDPVILVSLEDHRSEDVLFVG